MDDATAQGPTHAATQSPEIRSDRRADRAAIALVGAMTAASLTISIFTTAWDVSRSRMPISTAEIVTLETSSHLVIFALALLIPPLLNRAPVAAPWGRAAAIHAGALAGFSLAHIAGMYALRLLLFPPLVGAPYGVNLFSPPELVYEFQKDAYTYVLIVFGFSMLRALGQQKLETEAALAAARRDSKVTLKSGGASFFVNAADIITAKAAGNYIEVKTASKTFLARMTISALERLLTEAGGAHVRAHRSYIVNREQIQEITPADNGGVNIRLSTGEVIPGSRNFRDRLPNA